MAKVLLYEDIMHVAEVDPDGKRFDKGKRCLRCPPSARTWHSPGVSLCARNLGVRPCSVAPALPRRKHRRGLHD